MSHFAKVIDGIVTNVIVAEKDFIDALNDNKLWIQTSYNTHNGVYYNPITNEIDADQSKALRGNFAGIGYVYDEKNDVFYEKQPFPSWTLNTSTWLWDAPIPYPNDGNHYEWNELNQTWDSIK